MKWAILGKQQISINEEGDALNACYFVGKAYKNTLVVDGFDDSLPVEFFLRSKKLSFFDNYFLIITVEETLEASALIKREYFIYQELEN